MNLIRKFIHLARLKHNEINIAILGKDKEATIQFETVGNYIYFQVVINGRDLGFILDSAGLNMISTQAAEMIGLKTSELHPSHLGAGDHKHNVSICRINDITIGNKIILNDQYLRVADLPRLPENKPLHGIIGIEIFRRFVVCINYESRTLLFTEPMAYRKNDEDTTTPLRILRSGVPTISGALDGLPCRFMLDTGNGASLEIFSHFAKKHDLYNLYNSTSPVPVGAGLGGTLYARIARSHKLIIGTVTVDNSLVNLSTADQGAFSSRHIQGNIGGRILKRFTVTFDFSRKLIYISPNKHHKNPMKDSLFLNRAGLFFEKIEKGFLVVNTLSDSPADNAGIKAKEVIYKVNGEAASTLSLAALRKILCNNVPHAQVQLTIGEGRSARNVVVRLRQLVPLVGGGRPSGGHSHRVPRQP